MKTVSLTVKDSDDFIEFEWSIKFDPGDGKMAEAEIRDNLAKLSRSKVLKYILNEKQS